MRLSMQVNRAFSVVRRAFRPVSAAFVSAPPTETGSSAESVCPRARICCAYPSPSEATTTSVGFAAMTMLLLHFFAWAAAQRAIIRESMSAAWLTDEHDTQRTSTLSARATRRADFHSTE